MGTLYSPQFPLQLLVYEIFGIDPISILISLCCGCTNLLRASLCPADDRMLTGRLPYVAAVRKGILWWYQSEDVVILLKSFLKKPQNLK